MQVKQYVVFYLNEEEYGIGIEYTREILRVKQKITKIPDMPSFVEGVIELRGKVITVINLRKRFGFEGREIGRESKLLIVNAGDTMIAFLVDDVSDIMNFTENQIENLDNMISGMGRNSVKGIGRVEEKLVILLDLEKLSNEVFRLDIKGEQKC